MPAGDYESGDGPAGFDPVIVSDPETRYLAGPARQYDPRIRDWASDENGNANTAHPVDQQMVTQLTLGAKSIRSALNIGNELGQITHIDSEKHESLVKDILTRAVSRLTSARRAEVLDIFVEVDPDTDNTRSLASVQYRNLETNDPPRTVSL